MKRPAKRSKKASAQKTRTQKAGAQKTSRQCLRLPHLRDLSVTYEGRNEDFPVRPPDISERGMFINTSSHFVEGSVLKLRFQLTHSRVEVATRCEVRYCLDGVGIGVEFVDLPPDCARAIEEEIRIALGARGSG